MNQELPEVKAGFTRGRGTRDQIANICWIMEKAREFQKNIYFCFIDYPKAFDCVQFSSVAQVVSDSLRPYELQHTRLLCPSLSLRVCSNSCPLSWWCHPIISSSFSPCALSLLQHQGLFQWVSSLHQVAKVLELQLQHQSFQWIFKVDIL